ncbi:hypothetical protein CEXT_404341 [Caerostris extrusa]|uniref:Uncharacterized protein n=1 Tax=Caerostris extrusa TaxID=172846 RepID=A0AAV4XLK1_CAEEX|nr:hypothetical protein CEXT_404341 [Caerostris extrusa]
MTKAPIVSLDSTFARLPNWNLPMTQPRGVLSTAKPYFVPTRTSEIQVATKGPENSPVWIVSTTKGHMLY